MNLYFLVINTVLSCFLVNVPPNVAVISERGNDEVTDRVMEVMREGQNHLEIESAYLYLFDSESDLEPAYVTPDGYAEDGRSSDRLVVIPTGSLRVKNWKSALDTMLR